MKTVLVVYDSRYGHTARIARCIWETIINEGHQADMMNVLEADREGVDWNKYDTVIAGAPVLYGKFRRDFLGFVNSLFLTPRPTVSSAFPLLLVHLQRLPQKVTFTAVSSLKIIPGIRRM